MGGLDDRRSAGIGSEPVVCEKIVEAEPGFGEERGKRGSRCLAAAARRCGRPDERAAVDDLQRCPSRRVDERGPLQRAGGGVHIDLDEHAVVIEMRDGDRDQGERGPDALAQDRDHARDRFRAGIDVIDDQLADRSEVELLPG
jgi:hypothetical protein